MPAISQIRGLDPVWILDLDLGGDVRRYASRAVEITDRNGDTWQYAGGLIAPSVEIGEALESIGIQIIDEDEDWARYLARGGRLSMREAELALWWPGLLREEALGVLSGLTANRVAAPPGERGRLTLAIRSSLLDNVELSPHLQAVIDETTFDHVLETREIDPKARGQSYPLIFGYPGTGDPNEDEVSPTGIVELNIANTDTTIPDYRLVICIGTVDAAQVHLWDLDEGQATLAEYLRNNPATVGQDTDKLGQTYSYAAFPTSELGVDPVPRIGHTYTIGFRNASGWGGGILNREQTGPLRGLGEVIRYCLEQSGVQTDTGRQEAERRHLDRYKIDGLIAGASRGRVDLAAWVNDELPKLFPIRRMRSERGLWYRFFNWWANPWDAVARLDADASEIARVSGLERFEGQHNVFEIAYGGVPGRRPPRRRILAPDAEEYVPFLGVDERVFGSRLCKASEQLYGRRLIAPPVETEYIWSGSTALGILEHWAARDALPVDRVAYEGRHLETLQPGDVVLINDSSLYLTDRVALVDTVTVGGSLTSLRLLLPNRPEVRTS